MDERERMADTLLYHWYGFEGSVIILVLKLQVLPCSHPCFTPRQSDRADKSHGLLALERELLQLLEGDEEDDVPRPQSEPVRPKSLIKSKETLIPPRLHHSVQCSFVHWAP